MTALQLHARAGQVGNNRRSLHAALDRRGPSGINLLYSARLVNPRKVEPCDVHAAGDHGTHDARLLAGWTDGCDYLRSGHVSVFSISISLVYFWLRSGFVGAPAFRYSHPTPTASVSPADARNAEKPSQSSSVNGSSIETSGYFFSIDAYHADIFSLSKCSILLAAISSASLHWRTLERTQASDSNSNPSSLFFRRGENPPSSPSAVSYPFSASRSRSDS